MKYFTLLIIIFLIASCSSYKVETAKEFDFSRIKENDEQHIELEKINDYPKGWQCFEPLLYVLTLGIIPTHCVDDYRIKVEGENLGEAKVTAMSGWFPLVLAVSPKWKYGANPKIESDIIKQSKNK